MKNLVKHGLAALGYQIRQLPPDDALYQRAEGLYTKYASHTMIPKETFIANLELIARHAPNTHCYVECGVWRGGMTAAAAELIGDACVFHLCDSFEGLPEVQPEDGKAAQEWQSNTESPFYYENCKAEQAHAEKVMQLSGVAEYHLHKGWFADTLPKIAPSLTIDILRLDADWYASTIEILQHLYPKVVQGGLVLIDDYTTWEGCSKAIHAYLASIQSVSVLRQYNNCVTYLIKLD